MNQTLASYYYILNGPAKLKFENQSISLAVSAMQSLNNKWYADVLVAEGFE